MFSKLPRSLSVPAVAGFSLVFLSGCTFFNTQSPDTDPNTQTTVQSEETVKVSGQDGDTQFQIGGSLPTNWPSQLATPDNATVTTATTTTNPEDNTTIFSATFSSTASVADALATLKSKYEAAGWNIDSNLTNTTTASGGFVGDLNGANVTAVFIDGGTEEATFITVTGELPN